MSQPNTFILIKGQPKAFQIERIRLGEKGVYAVQFKNSTKWFHYRWHDVVILKNPIWHDPKHSKVVVDGREQNNVTDILSFQEGFRTHWRITFANGYVKDYLAGTVRLIESCLGDKVAKNAFDYLRRIATINELGKDEEQEGLLSNVYENITFLDNTMAAAPYLDAEKFKVSKMSYAGWVFPFGCNASQEKAVTAAFENQISVIQGPPGTGKTQTILNIIANILMQDKTVLVVSNNNSATANVLEKLQKYGFGFIVASLGRRENKEQFIQHQPAVPQELQSWDMKYAEVSHIKTKISDAHAQLRQVFQLQEELASHKQELKEVELEWEHFMHENPAVSNTSSLHNDVKAKHVMELLMCYQSLTEERAPKGILARLIAWIKKMKMHYSREVKLGIKIPLDKGNYEQNMQELQAVYYQVRTVELKRHIGEIEKRLKGMDAQILSAQLSSSSLVLLKKALFNKYHEGQRRIYSNTSELAVCHEEVCKQYPVVLSTTFSARTTLRDHTYDYVIMDEASQVSIETGALALTCARNAVIVGDTMQLPNVVTEEDRVKLDGIFAEFKVAPGFNSAKYSFLHSVCAILPDVQQTLLREHYRCHPTIINFCNQRFYGGHLLIMTEDHDEKDVIMAIKTVPGHHARGHYNQREIDVVKNEVLPRLSDKSDVGIITPYNDQVREFNRQIPSVEAATIHKYQGREKDTIIMSVVDDQITEFSDDANMINVAISRAKKQFCLVVSGNEQEREGNISELIEYIEYHNLSVTESQITSIFDYLYSNYTKERLAFLARHKNISEYDSENLTYSLIENILRGIPAFSHLGVFCHMPLRSIIRDWSLLDEEEKRYISHYSTHVDFLIINHVTKKPVLAIETDGYNYHNDETEQHQRDLKKNHILELYGIPLLRLKTNESGEKEKIVNMLSDLTAKR